jgi:Calcineurin-like phosphoesterase
VLETDGDGGANAQSYFRFAVSGVSGTVQSAKLRAYVVNGSTNAPAVYTTSDFSEAGLNWSNKPPPVGLALDDKGSVPTSTYVEYDLKSTVTGNGTYNFVSVPTSTDGLDVNSREYSTVTRRPTLELVVEDGPDEAPPETTIDDGPSETTTGNSVSFAFSSNEAGSTFECRLDQDAFGPCTSPKGYTGLPKGSHTFEVRATDAAGNVDATPAVRSWVVDDVSVLWAVGDGDAGASSKAVADRMTGQIDRFLYLGDVYETGSAREFQENFDPVWGRFKGVGNPTPGNHDSANHLTGYDPYWGARAPHTNGGHWYSYSERGWQVISLNSEEPMSVGSPQYTWLQGQLASGGNCRIAYFHRPRYSAGSHGDNPVTQPLWDLMAGRVRLVLNGHDHDMQRAHPVNGITEFVSGAGGHGLYAAQESDPRFAFLNDTEYGALRLRLRSVGSNPDGGATAEHAFIAADDGATLDAGSVSCSPPSPSGTDTTPPDTTIDSGPPATTTSSSGSFAFSSNEPGSTFDCLLDSGSFSACASPMGYTGLSPGQHTFQVRARDQAGNADPTPASRTWTITGGGGGGTSTVSVAAAADAFVRQRAPSSNYGSATVLETDGDTGANAESYFRFTVSGLAGMVQSAKLRTYVVNGSSNAPAVYRTGDFSQTGLNWSNRPGRLGTALDDKGSVATNTYVEYDVKVAVTGNGTYNFVTVPTSTDGLDVNSRELSTQARRPTLELVVDGG